MNFKFGFNIMMWVVLLTVSYSAVAQKKDIKFKHISYKDGLYQTPVTSMLQDKSGYIWIGNWSGLSRYDGTSFKNFRQNDSSLSSISHNRINKLYEDRTGNIWVATSGGLNRYNRHTEKFLRIGILTGKGGGNFISSLQQDSYGKMWVSTFKGLKYYNPKTQNLQEVVQWRTVGEFDLFNGISFALAEDQQKTIWVGVNQGLKRFEPKTFKVLALPDVIAKNKMLSAAKIVVIKQDPAGNIWFGTEESGLFTYNPKQNTCSRYIAKENDPNSLPSNWINDILFKEGKTWIATKNGLSIFDHEKQIFSNYNHNSADLKSISDDTVWSLMEDHTGNVWVGTYAGGINIFYPGNSNFTNIGERIGNNLGLNKPLSNTIVADGNDAFWVGTFGGGLNYINRKHHTAKYYSVKDVNNGRYSNDVKALVKDSSGKLWVGTLDGLIVFNIGSESFSSIHLEILNGKRGAKLINALVLDENGIWVGTNGGGLRFVTYNGKETKSFLHTAAQKDGLSDNYVNAIVKDGNYIWVATQNGLNRYDKKTDRFSVFRRKNHKGLGNNNVLTLFKDSKNRLWIGTDGGGLNCMNLNTYQIDGITQADGLINDVVTSVVEDNVGQIWASTNNGLSAINLTDAGFPFRHHYKIANYNAGNGLPGNQFLVNASIKTNTGELLFGGMNGVTTFYPNQIIKNIAKPAILLTGFYIKNKEILPGKNSPLTLPINEIPKIKLSYAENNIMFRFSALNFINPDQNTYAYQMVGISKRDEWSKIGNQKEVSFVNLEPGTYTFKVKAGNNDGVWNHVGRSVVIEILPPFWRTWSAYFLYLMTLVIITFKIIEFFRARAKLKRDLYNEHLQNEKQEEFYKLKLDFFTNISHEIRTPLTLILGPVENLYEHTKNDSKINKQVVQIKSNAERLFRLIGELMDFRKAETGNMVLYLQKNNVVPFLKEIFLSFVPIAESKHINYDFISDAEEIELYTDKDQLEKVFFNLLSNAFKFTPDHGKIAMEVLHTNDWLTVLIVDNGKGIPLANQDRLFTNYYQVQPDQSQPGTGVGLALSKSIIELHHGTIGMSSSTDELAEVVTVFKVELPLQKRESANVHIIPEVIATEGLLFEHKMDVAPIDEIAQEEIIVDKKYTVLLAEDNEELRSFIAESLSSYHIISCVNGAEAFDQATDQIPDLIVSDIMMPIMTGLELCEQIKTDDRTSHIPVILLTALATHVHQVNGLELGADVYLTKPFSTKILSLHVQNLINSREVIRKKFGESISLLPQGITISAKEDEFIKKLTAIIESHMENPEFGVVSLGNEIGMSKTVLYKKICAITDLSPSDFIKSMRLKRAELLLAQNKLSVNEVASLVGFNDRKYFSKEFKKMFGKSPSEVVGG